MKKTKILFWTTTGILFIFFGVMPALTGHTEMAKEGIRHLGYPDYFGVVLTIFKILGSLVLIIPQVPKRLKEWAYAGFTFDIVFAFISNWAVDGPTMGLLFPVVILAILIISYRSFHQLATIDEKRTVIGH
ncbi:MAG: DoxX family protein [Sediminicola sp.]|tara:strand:- start:21023 stop:21415 length:393 start_codon:yes stop_codon:yes gene_type:complete